MNQTLEKTRLHALAWYPFKEGSKIAEVSDSFFCVNRDNVSYYHEKDFEGNKKFDYIVFTNTISDSLLKKGKENLKENGHIIVLVNNSLALHQIAYQPYNRENLSKENKYSKKELENLFTSFFKYSYFYYVFPSFQIAEEIFTDNTIHQMKQINSYIPNEYDEVMIHSEKELMFLLQKNQVADLFANSYIVDLCDQNDFYHTDYIKIHSYNDKKYSILTDVNKDKKLIIKKPLSTEAKEHLKKMSENQFDYYQIKSLSYKWNEEKQELTCPFVENPCLKDVLSSFFDQNDMASFYQEIDRFIDNFYHQEKDDQKECVEFEKVFGTRKVTEPLCWIKPANVDMNFDNIFLNQDQYIGADNEWCFEFAVPSEYVLWIAFDLFLSSDKKYQRIEKELLSKLNVKEDTIEVFKDWSLHFRKEYVYDHNLGEHYEVSQMYDVIEDFEKIKNSSSWKITKPLRKIVDKIK